jgi:tetratricopeptide (TPR) repeat protein
MRFTDARGLSTTAASEEAVRRLDATVEAYLAFRADTGDRLKEAQSADPACVLAHTLRGYFMLLFETRPFLERAKKALAAADNALSGSEVTPRERAHVEALRRWCRGEWEATAAQFDAILMEHPRDAIAFKMAQYLHFYLGDAEAMRDSAARCLFAWDETVPGYSYILGSYAFALEEAGAYAEAEKAGRRAVELQPCDVWAAHAVAHVMEMQGRARDGIGWIGGLDRNWDACHNFRYHILWHRCLFHVDLEEWDRALELYDREVRDQSTEEYLDITNAASMLWRLEQNGIEVGRRWQELAERSAQHVGDRMLVFADAHYAMALAAAGDAEGHLADLRDWAASGSGTEALLLQECGLALIEGLVAYRRGEWARAVDLLVPIRRAIRRVGGSHAQRDVFQRTLVDAALRDERWSLARALVAERLARKPENPWNRKAWARVETGLAAA